MSKKRRTKIALFGHFDGSNFGNECTLQAFLHYVRCYRPNTEIICITTGPEAAAATYQIKAIPISGDFVKSWRPQRPLLKLIRRVLIGIPGELYRWIDGLVKLRQVEFLIVPGTGLLTDAWFLTYWGPYSSFRWSLLAKCCGCKVLFVSVGAGPIYTALGRWLVTSALSLADFRSYRDHSTIQYLESIGFRAETDRIYPDLAFSLPPSAIPRQHSESCPRAVVGLGLIDDPGRYTNSNPSSETYAAYLENLASVVSWLLAQENVVRLLIGSLADVPRTLEFRALLRQRLPMFDEARVVDEPVRSVKDLLSQIASTDIVVATRFHNVVFALLCEKPVIAISFHHKCESLMAAMGLSDYCLDINDLKADQLIEKIRDIKMNAAKLKLFIREKNEQFRKALEEQYELIFEDSQLERSDLFRGSPDGRKRSDAV
jgi:polysaccharide pyruvyl transferase WcaK-like protein